MKTKSAFFIALIFLFVISIKAQNVSEMPTITVTGTAEVQVVPDEVIFSFEVEKTDKDLQLAKKMNDDSVSQILALARTFAIPEKNVKTDYISVSVEYGYAGKPQRRVFMGYEVSKTVIIRLTDISKFENFFSEILKTGITEVKNVTFQTSQIRKYKDEARASAIKAAQEKASALTKEVGQTIGKAVSIREGIFSGGTTGFRIDGASGANNAFLAANTNTTRENISSSFSDSDAATFSPGTITVKAEVTVSFLLY